MLLPLKTAEDAFSVFLGVRINPSGGLLEPHFLGEAPFSTEPPAPLPKEGP